MSNYFDKDGNYINVENLSLADIYHQAFELGVASKPSEDERSLQYSKGYQDGFLEAKKLFGGTDREEENKWQV